MSFEALNYYKGLTVLCAKSNHFAADLKHINQLNPQISVGMILGNIALFRLCKRNNLFSKAYNSLLQKYFRLYIKFSHGARKLQID